MNHRTGFISTITGVREVALSGSADLSYWRQQLQGEGLTPLEQNGRASLLLTAIEAKFRGLPFRELSISVLLEDGGAFLAHAFNSSRLLALAERVFFQTPYHLAELALNEQFPARMGVARAGRPLFSASMGDPRSPEREHDALFDGAIYLPGGQKVFYARLSGMAALYPYHLSDNVTFAPGAGEQIFDRLSESGFAGTEWLVRAGAVHARSRTYKR